ncbi:T-cell receptor alpha chain V region HPB-MLT [Tupaia chinensis]|nr:T-cell receptor alpha chain V region HPB-MLT [Tupaia chinensis]
MAQTVTQAQTATSVMEKGSVTLGCGYETSDTTYYLFWYKQPPSGEMIALIRQDSYNEKNTSEGRYFLTFLKSARSINLTISASQLTDSAVYFCALREHRDVGACRSPTETSTGDSAPRGGAPSQTGRSRAVSTQLGVWQGNWGSINIDVQIDILMNPYACLSSLD